MEEAQGGVLSNTLATPRTAVTRSTLASTTRGATLASTTRRVQGAPPARCVHRAARASKESKELIPEQASATMKANCSE